MTAFGGDVTRQQFIKLACALCMGTLVEWYDFSVFSQLSNVITAAFFPPNQPELAQLSFWAVYAAGYLSRPLGALVFGHIGDSRGRRVGLLISVLLITLPTLLIGCLPTYAQAGLVAPILMALLRFIQGIAVGGEFGSAITYLYEMAPIGHKGFTASLGQAAVSPGMILGLFICQAVLYGCTPDQLMLWGWRVPFLVTVGTAPLALYLRLHMPEPYEFLQDKKQMVLQRVASTAASRVAHSFSRRTSLHSSLRATSSIGTQQLQLALAALRWPSTPAAVGASGAVGKPGQAAAAAGNTSVDVSNVPDVQEQAVMQQLSARQVSLLLQRSLSVSADGRLAVSVTADGRLAVSAAGLAQGHHQPAGAAADKEVELVVLGCEQELEREVQQLSASITHHVPLAVLLREHWRGLLLQVLLEACYGATFYTFFTWAPSYMSKELHIQASSTLWALMIGLVLFAACVLLAGHFVGDTTVPKVWALVVVTAVCAVVTMPVVMVLQTGHAIGLWLLLPLMLGLSGLLGGIMTTIGPQIYPPGVRTSGYNLGHNLCMSLFGGLCPLIIAALAVAVRPATTAAGLVMVMTAVVSCVAGVALIKVAPGCNAPCPAGQHLKHLQQAQLQQLVVQH